jgi:hypothetical protein
VIFTADPPWIRLVGAQLLTQATEATVGAGAYVAPPLDAWLAAGAIPMAKANPIAGMRMPRMTEPSLFLAYGVS